MTEMGMLDCRRMACLPAEAIDGLIFRPIESIYLQRHLAGSARVHMQRHASHLSRVRRAYHYVATNQLGNLIQSHLESVPAILLSRTDWSVLIT